MKESTFPSTPKIPRPPSISPESKQTFDSRSSTRRLSLAADQLMLGKGGPVSNQQPQKSLSDGRRSSLVPQSQGMLHQVSNTSVNSINSQILSISEIHKSVLVSQRNLNVPSSHKRRASMQAISHNRLEVHQSNQKLSTSSENVAPELREVSMPANFKQDTNREDVLRGLPENIASFYNSKSSAMSINNDRRVSRIDLDNLEDANKSVTNIRGSAEIMNRFLVVKRWNKATSYIHSCIKVILAFSVPVRRSEADIARRNRGTNDPIAKRVTTICPFFKKEICK
jgi:hypothetical protein